MNGAEIQATIFVGVTVLAVVGGAVLIGILKFVSTEKQIDLMN